MAGQGGPWGRWRIAAWGAAAALLLLPLAAMQVTEAVAWDGADFALAGGLLAGAGVAGELVARSGGSRAYRAGAGVALATAVLLLWANGAVGLIGSEDNPANRLYPGVVALGLLGAVLARFRPRGMARVLAGTALAQAAVPGVALLGGWGVAGPVPVGDVLMATAAFVALWLLSAALFRAAARRGAAP